MENTKPFNYCARVKNLEMLLRKGFLKIKLKINKKILKLIFLISRIW
jgi:hypothetical protein